MSYSISNGAYGSSPSSFSSPSSSSSSSFLNNRYVASNVTDYKDSQLDNSINCLSQENIQAYCGLGDEDSYGKKVIAHFIPPSNESIGVQGRILTVLGGILRAHREEKNLFAPSVCRDFVLFLSTMNSEAGVTEGSQVLWLKRLQEAFDESSKPAIFSVARKLRTGLQNACVNLTAASTKALKAGLKIVMQIVQRSGDFIISLVRGSGNWLRNVFAKFMTAKGDKSTNGEKTRRLIQDPNVLKQLTQFKMQVLCHFESKLDVNFLSQDQKESLIRALADFLAKENDQEFSGEYPNSHYADNFERSHGYNLLNSMMKDNVLIIKRALEQAFDAAKSLSQ